MTWQTGDFSASLPGGMGEKHPHVPVDHAQMRAGQKVELEHTPNPQIAAEIASDHLAEIPDYYTRLDRMEEQADAQGMKIAEMTDAPLAPELVPLAAKHREAEEAYIDNANKEIKNTALKGHAISALADTSVNTLPGMSKMIAMSGGGSVADATQDNVEALHQKHQEGLEHLKAQHAAELELASREVKQAATMVAAPRGDQPMVPAPPLPGGVPAPTADKYHDGYAYAQAIGLNGLNQVTQGDVQRWVKHAPEWRQGFADACDRLGLKRIGDMLRTKTAVAKTASLTTLAHMFGLPGDLEKVAALGSTLGTLGGIVGGAAMGHVIAPIAGHFIAAGSPEFDASLAHGGEEFGAGFGALSGNRLGHVVDVATGLERPEKRQLVPQLSKLDMSPHTTMV